MPDQLKDRARKAAEEIAWVGGCGVPKESFIKMLSDIIERHWRELLEEKNRYAEKSRPGEVKLKSCPFCGSAVGISHSIGDFWVKCFPCGASG